MGQRLVITIHVFDEDIAKIYYHWSTYTTSALQEAKDIINNVNWFNTTSKDELILRITRQLEECGGHCEDCAYAGKNCWVLKKGQSVVLREH